jgi:hypothetical protein
VATPEYLKYVPNEFWIKCLGTLGYPTFLIYLKKSYFSAVFSKVQLVIGANFWPEISPVVVLVDGPFR